MSGGTNYQLVLVLVEEDVVGGTAGGTGATGVGTRAGRRADSGGTAGADRGGTDDAGLGAEVGEGVPHVGVGATSFDLLMDVVHGVLIDVRPFQEIVEGGTGLAADAREDARACRAAGAVGTIGVGTRAGRRADSGGTGCRVSGARAAGAVPGTGPAVPVVGRALRVARTRVDHEAEHAEAEDHLDDVRGRVGAGPVEEEQQHGHHGPSHDGDGPRPLGDLVVEATEDFGEHDVMPVDAVLQGAVRVEQVGDELLVRVVGVVAVDRAEHAPDGLDAVAATVERVDEPGVTAS